MKRDVMYNKSASSDHEHYLSMVLAYDNRIDAILPMSDRFFDSCISFIPEGPISILELGSGTGYATSKICAANPQALITCIDHSPDMIRCASQKPELNAVAIIEQDIRDPWPATKYDVIMTTLCLHHIPEKDRLVLLKRIYEALSPNGKFICGDIIRPDSLEVEAIYQDRWVSWMSQAGMTTEESDKMIHSRNENFPDMETVPGFYNKIKDAGFPRVLMPYKNEIAAVFVGYRS
ncbi:MAG: class I SAM-dependent methyltransferase [Methanospirillum sp.]|uniref:class I SAM-dependent methyltransferase n=1 Tax=Methanospirillum sp. TaxID=45200 RepID=UPI002372478F|nr:class I SAM-dependent methyltransferase [Methanospirillum sp.]MDD1728486.1 class I SAM-dependent methyltransferase [Methanospirillum sp.]